MMKSVNMKLAVVVLACVLSLAMSAVAVSDTKESFNDFETAVNATIRKAKALLTVRLVFNVFALLACVSLLAMVMSGTENKRMKALMIALLVLMSITHIVNISVYAKLSNGDVANVSAKAIRGLNSFNIVCALTVAGLTLYKHMK